MIFFASSFRLPSVFTDLRTLSAFSAGVVQSC